MIAEAFAPSFGDLGVGGAAAFVAGSIMLMDTEAPGFGLSPWLVGVLTLMNLAFFAFVLGKMVAASACMLSLKESTTGGRGPFWWSQWCPFLGRGSLFGPGREAKLEPSDPSPAALQTIGGRQRRAPLTRRPWITSPRHRLARHRFHFLGCSEAQEAQGRAKKKDKRFSGPC